MVGETTMVITEAGTTTTIGAGGIIGAGITTATGVITEAGITTADGKPGITTAGTTTGGTDAIGITTMIANVWPGT